MAAPYRFVDCDHDTRKTYGARVKDKFKWEWLTEKDTHGDFLSSDIRKIDAGWLAWCCFCRNVVNYSNSGKAKWKVDQRESRLNETNHQLLAAIQATQDKISANQPPKDTVTLICKKLGRQYSQQSKVFWSEDKQ